MRNYIALAVFVLIVLASSSVLVKFVRREHLTPAEWVWVLFVLLLAGVLFWFTLVSFIRGILQ